MRPALRAIRSRHEARSASQRVLRGGVRSREVAEIVHGKVLSDERVYGGAESRKRSNHQSGLPSHSGRIGREAVVKRPAWISGRGEQNAARLPAPLYQEQNGIRLEEAGEITKRWQLGPAADAHLIRSAEGNDHTAVQASRHGISARRILGAGNILSEEAAGRKHHRASA